jgi:hypothetical protein
MRSREFEIAAYARSGIPGLRTTLYDDAAVSHCSMQV